jgi:2-dehydro-3-deoxyphosphogluconate aldolase/(4S)-4-hydroxy-2-oxoglutarate aldolase
MSTVAGSELMVGAGTVLNTVELHQALGAGATFVVIPTLVVPVVDYCREHDIPVFPGALTPGEIHRAWQSGATMVKLFPSSCFGPSYLKEIKAPFQNIELLACGGITPENAGSYFAAGASAVAFGGSVFNHTWLKNREFDKIGSRIEAFVQSVRAHHPA